MNVITSRQNPLIIKIAALSDSKKRRAEGLFCFEGAKLLGEAADSGVPLEYIFATLENLNFCRALLKKYNLGEEIVYEVSGIVYEKLSSPFGQNSPEGIFCVAKSYFSRENQKLPIDKSHIFDKIYNNVDNTKSTLKIFLVSVRDPGNLGAIIRSAAALGVGEVIISFDSVDIYNPKVVRGAMGALFKMRITVVEDVAASIAALRAEHKVYAAALDSSARTVDTVDFSERSVVLIGNEGAGLPREIIALCDAAVIIPITGGAESLNAAVAASIFMWEAARKTKIHTK